MAQDFRRYTSPNVGTAPATVMTADSYDTVVGISISNVTSGTINVDCYINDGTNDIYLLKAQSVEANSTFIWNDRIVIGAGDKVSVFCDSAANVDVYYTYIDQDWT